MTIQEFYEKWKVEIRFLYPHFKWDLHADLHSLIRHYGGDPGADTLTRTVTKVTDTHEQMCETNTPAEEPPL